MLSSPRLGVSAVILAKDWATNNFPISAAASQSVMLSAAKNLASVAIPPRFFAALSNDELFGAKS